ncbi:MAG: exosortase/archaeosortase family protein [Planctomycetota bacterium]|nr:exosortase/archaeosortase family protein [Planctomycetota bacterium]
MQLPRTMMPTQVAMATALVVLSVAAGWAAWRDMISVATEREDQSHILLAVPVAIWLGVVRAGRLRFVSIEPSWWGAAACVGGILLSAAGFRLGIDLLWHAGAVVSVGGAVVSVFGVSAARKFLPSFLALGFLLPVPGRLRQPIALPLQEISARVTEFVLDLIALPIARSGNILVINDQEVAVAEACNGMRMVGSLALVTFAFAFSIPMRNRIRLALLIASPLVALLVNIVRLIPTTLMYGYSSKPAADTFHDVSGWAVLALALGILWLMLHVMQWMEIRTVNYAVDA